MVSVYVCLYKYVKVLEKKLLLNKNIQSNCLKETGPYEGRKKALQGADPQICFILG